MKKHLLYPVSALLAVFLAATVDASPIFTSQNRSISGSVNSTGPDYSSSDAAPDLGVFNSIVQNPGYFASQNTYITSTSFGGQLTASTDLDPYMFENLTVRGVASSICDIRFEVTENTPYSFTATLSRIGSGHIEIHLDDNNGPKWMHWLSSYPSGSVLEGTLTPGFYTLGIECIADMEGFAEIGGLGGEYHTAGSYSASFRMTMPEPATLTLLAIGALALRRRGKVR